MNKTFFLALSAAVAVGIGGYALRSLWKGIKDSS